MARRKERTDNPYDGTDDPGARSYSSGKKRGEADDEDVRRAVQRMVERCRDYVEDDLAPKREKAWRYYNGEVEAKSKKGRSKAVDRVVRDTVDGILPQLIRVFASADMVARYTAVTAKDQEMARSATLFADNVFKKQNQGFRHLHDHVKDGLVGAVGVFRTYCSHTTETTQERYENLTPDELTMLLSDDSEEVEVLSVEQRQVAPPPPPASLLSQQPSGVGAPPAAADAGGAPPPVPPMNPPAPQPGGPMAPPPPPPPTGSGGGALSNVVPIRPGALGQPDMRIDITLKRTHHKKRIVIDTVDPAEFLIDPRATEEDDAYCIGMDAIRPASDVIAMGIDAKIVEDIATARDDDRSGEKQARRPLVDPADTGPDEDIGDRSIRVVDVIVRIDQDGDGVAERRHIIALGEEFQIVRNEPTDECPYAVGSPILMPHSCIGEGIADLVIDLQDIQTAILRQQLDSLYQAVNPRTVVVETQVNIGDVVDNQFNGVIRARAPGMVQPYNVEFVGQQAFPMVERIDQIRENRTGLSRASQGLQADALQSSTEVGVRAVIGAALMKIELLARTYAETSIKRLFRQILFLAVRYQMEPLTVQHNGEPLTIDPRAWKADLGVDVEVGLGTGNEDERRQALMFVLQKQQEALMQLGPLNPLCDLSNVRNTMDDLMALTPYKDASRYFKDVTPQAMQEYAQLQAEQAKAAKGGGEDQQSKMADVQRKAQEGQMKLQLADKQGQQKLELQARTGQQQMMLKGQQAQADLELERLKLMGNMQLDRERTSADMQTGLVELQAETALEKYKVDERVKVDTRLRKPSASAS